MQTIAQITGFLEVSQTYKNAKLTSAKFFSQSPLISILINSVLNIDHFHKININMCQLRESNVNWAPFYLLLAISK